MNIYTNMIVSVPEGAFAVDQDGNSINPLPEWADRMLLDISSSHKRCSDPVNGELLVDAVVVTENIAGVSDAISALGWTLHGVWTWDGRAQDHYELDYTDPENPVAGAWVPALVELVPLSQTAQDWPGFQFINRCGWPTR